VVANRLRSAFEIESALIETKPNHEPFAITTSIGIAELQHDEKFESLIRRADTALYLAKDNGRNCCEIAYLTN
jgi:diguanylate cyclase (GGDEF)-like protein